MPVFPMSVRPLIVRQGTTTNAGFLPTDLSGLVAWYDASKITGLADGAAVATWNDSSGNGFHLTQSTAGFRPLYKTAILNSLPAVRFDGIDDYMDTATSTNVLQTSTETIVIVYANRSGVNGTLYSTASIAAGPLQRNATVWFDGATASIALSQNLNDNFLFTMTLDYVDDDYTVRLDGAQVGQDLTTNGALPDTELRIGARGDPVSEFFAGDMLEILVYDRELTAGEVSQVESYAADKYAITLG